MRTRSLHRPRRPGFTIPELLVSAAVCMVIMALLAHVFQVSMDTMRQMRSHADLADQLRATRVVMKRDLQYAHFLTEDTKPFGGRRVSNLWDNNVQLGLPAGGFFRIRSTASQFDVGVGSTDDAGIQSTRRDGTLMAGHLLHFTSIVPGGADQFTATVQDSNPPFSLLTYTSQAAELAYFLDPTPTGTTGSLPTYNLIRRQRLVAFNATDKGKYPPQAPAPGANLTVDPAAISISPMTSAVNSLADLTTAANRLGGTPPAVPAVPTNVSYSNPIYLNAYYNAGYGDGNLAPVVGTPSNPRFGEDTLLSSVLSFEVKVIWIDPAASPVNPTNPRPYPANPPQQIYQNTDHPFDNLEQVPLSAMGRAVPEYDSSKLSGNPEAVWVKVVQIKIRIWDPKLQNARQMTLIVDL